MTQAVPAPIVRTHADLAAYNRTLAGLDQFQRAKLRALNRIANVARFKARREARV